MPFMVIHRMSDGSSCFEQSDVIDEAALLVERLRNQDGIDQIRIYRMEEINFAFRPYYKVELGLPERQNIPTPPSAITAGVTEGAPSAPEATDHGSDVPLAAASDASFGDFEAPDPPIPPPPGADGEATGPNGRRGIFGR